MKSKLLNLYQPWFSHLSIVENTVTVKTAAVIHNTFLLEIGHVKWWDPFLAPSKYLQVLAISNIEVESLNASYIRGMTVASGSSKFLLYIAVLFSLPFKYLCKITKHSYNDIWWVSSYIPWASYNVLSRTSCINKFQNIIFLVRKVWEKLKVNHERKHKIQGWAALKPH